MLELSYLKYSGLDEAHKLGRFFLRDLSDMVFDEIMGGNFADEDDERIPLVERELTSYGISNIYYKNKQIHVVLGRPGVFIGPKGTTIDKIQKRWVALANKNDIEIDQKKPIEIHEDRRPLTEDLLYSVISYYYATNPEPCGDDFGI